MISFSKQKRGVKEHITHSTRALNITFVGKEVESLGTIDLVVVHSTEDKVDESK